MTKRPTETITGAGAGLAVYGFCTQVGLSELLAGIFAAVVVVVPYLVSEVVDVLRPHAPGPGSDSLLSTDAKAALEALGTPGTPGASSKTPFDAVPPKPMRKPRKK